MCDSPTRKKVIKILDIALGRRSEPAWVDDQGTYYDTIIPNLFFREGFQGDYSLVSFGTKTFPGLGLFNKFSECTDVLLEIAYGQKNVILLKNAEVSPINAQSFPPQRNYSKAISNESIEFLEIILEKSAEPAHSASEGDYFSTKVPGIFFLLDNLGNFKIILEDQERN